MASEETRQIVQAGADHAQTAKVMAAAGFGGMVLVFLRRFDKPVRATLAVLVAIGVGTIFTEPAMALVPDWTGFGPIQVAAVLGLIGPTLANAVLSAADKVDFSGLVPGNGKGE